MRIRGATVHVLKSAEEASYAYRGVVDSIEDPPLEHRRLRRRRGLDADRRGVTRRRAFVGAFARSRISAAHPPRARRRSSDEQGDRLCARAGRGAVRRARSAVAASRLRNGWQRTCAREGGRTSPRAPKSSPSRSVSSPNVLRADLRRRSSSLRRAPGRSRRGALLLISAQRLLGVPLEVARAGLREGVALSLLDEAAVAA